MKASDFGDEMLRLSLGNYPNWNAEIPESCTKQKKRIIKWNVHKIAQEEQLQES